VRKTERTVAVGGAHNASGRRSPYSNDGVDGPLAASTCQTGVFGESPGTGAIHDIAKEHPEHPPHPHSDNLKFADDDGSAHPGHATGKDKDISVQPSADPKIGDIATEHPEHPAHPHSDVNQLASFKFADEGSADSGHLAHPHFDNAKVPGTVMSDAASDQFVFEKGHDKVADVKPDMIETDHAVADIRHLLHTAHDANAVGALDPNHTTAPQDMTKVQLPHHHGDFHFA
jgi:hypothetical protein